LERERSLREKLQREMASEAEIKRSLLSCLSRLRYARYCYHTHHVTTNL
jgi:hypothetical protein